MLQALLLALLLQDPKPAPKTVEDRLKELDEKLTSLEKKQKGLSEENAGMEKLIADDKARRAQWAEQTAVVWVQRYAKPAQFDEKQSALFKELWIKWTQEDFAKPANVSAWKAREDALRRELRSEQIPLVARKVKEDQESNLRKSVSFFAQSAKLDGEKKAGFEKAVLAKMPIEEGPLLLPAYPERMNFWTPTLNAIESTLTELSSTLNEDERKALRKVLDQWKPKQR